MDINSFKSLLGKLKTWQARLATYIAMVNFGMIFYLFITQNNWLPWYTWVVLAAVGVIFIVGFDTKLVMPSQYSYEWEINPAVQKFLKNQKKIMDKLEIEEEE